MPAIVLVMGKKEGCNKMSKKTHFVTAPFFAGRRPEPIVIGDVVRRRPFIVHRRRFRCGVPPRLTRTDNIASSNPRLVEENPSTASGPPPLRRGGLRPDRGHRRGRPLTSQTAFGGQLPYEGSLGRPAAGVKDLKKILDNSFTQ